MKSKITVCIIFVAILLVPAYGKKGKDGNKYKPIVYEVGYEHDKWGTLPRDHIFKFRAYTTSFDGDDDNDGDGTGDKWGFPEWVAFEVRKKTIQVQVNRPSSWMSEEPLYAADKNVAPKDNSYHFAEATKEQHPYSITYNLSRGHMCPKNIANRLAKDADYNTHTILNACSQCQWFNNGIWKDLERLSSFNLRGKLNSGFDFHKVGWKCIYVTTPVSILELLILSLCPRLVIP